MLHWRDLSSVLRIIRRPSRPPKSGARAGRPSSERRYRAVTAIMSRSGGFEWDGLADAALKGPRYFRRQTSDF